MDIFKRNKNRKVDGCNYSGGENVESFLFICGLHRSGTTLVEHYISSLFSVSYLRANVPENEGQHLQDVYAPALAHGGPGRFAFSPEMSPAKPSKVEVDSFRQRILQAWRPYVVGDDAILSEKSPPNLTKIEWLRSVFPGSRFLIVVRDPRAVAGATQKWSKTSLEELVFHWSVAHSIAIKDLQDDCHIVTYEGFCEDPGRELAKSGLADILPARVNKVPLDPRFNELKNTNQKYIDMHSCQEYGMGAWDYFGYKI